MNGNPRLFNQQDLLQFFGQCLSSQEKELEHFDISRQTKFNFVSKILTLLSNLYDKNAETMDIPILVDKILSCQEYAEIVHQVKSEAQEIANEIINLRESIIVEKEFVSGHSTNTTESWSMGSLASGPCPGSLELASIMNDLKQSNITTRSTAAHCLKSFSVGDLLADEYWPVSKQCMELVLVDSDIEIATLGLRLFARGFQVAPNYLVPELYILLAKTIDVEPVKVVNVSDPVVELKWRQIRLLNQCMVYLPSIWSRFTELQMNEIMETTVLLFKSDETKKSLEWLAMVDPGATWFKAWMTSHVGRSNWMKAMDIHGLLSDICLDFLKYSKPSLKVHEVTGDTIYSDDIEYMYFCHVCVMIAQILMVRLGRDCFPVDLDVMPTQLIDQFTPTVFFSRLFTVLFSKRKLSNDNVCGAGRVTYRIENVYLDVVQEFMQASDTTILFQKEYLEQLMQYISGPHCETVSAILNVFATTDVGKAFLLREKAVDRIAQNVVDWCHGLVHDISIAAILGFMKLLKQFYVTCSGFEYLKRFDLPKHLATALEAQTDSIINDSIRECIFGFASTPLGLVRLHELGFIDQYASQPSTLDNALATQLSTCKTGMQALIKSKWLHAQFSELFSVLECEDQFGSQDIDQNRLSIVLMDIQKVFMSFSAVSACFEFELGNEQMSLPGLIKTILDTPNSLPQDSRTVFLEMTRHITSSLDTIILLQHKYKLVERLLDQHQYSFTNSLEFMLDANSILVNNLLLYVITIGGPNERILPPLKNPDPTSYSSMVFRGRGIPNGIYLDKPVVGRIIGLSSQIDNTVSLEQLKQLYRRVCNESVHVEDTVLLLDKLNSFLPQNQELMDNTNLSEHDKIGIVIANRYAARIIPKEKQELFKSTLSLALSQFKSFNDFQGFDWFVASMVMIYQGDENVLQLLYNVKSVPQIQSLWIQTDAESSISKIAHWIDIILVKECPQIYSAIQLAGITTFQIIEKWTRQSFWNIVDFDMIQRYLLISLIFGPEYQVYFLVSVLKSSGHILEFSRNDEMLKFLQEPLNVKIDYTDLFSLEQKYQIDL